MIRNVIREHHLTPSVIDAFFIDEVDHHGIEYWDNEIRKYSEEIKAALKPKEK